MGKLVKRNYDRETKIATVTIYDKGKIYKGIAKPSKEDFEYGSEYAGLTIAEFKAEILRNEKKNIADRKKIRDLKALEKHIEQNIEERVKRIGFFESMLQIYLDGKQTFRERTTRNRKIKAEMEGELKK